MTDEAVARGRHPSGLASWREGLDPSAPVWGRPAAALALLILLPLGWLGYMSVSSERGFTLGHYARVFTDPRMQKALWNTLVLAFWSGLGACALRAPVALVSPPAPPAVVGRDPDPRHALLRAPAVPGRLRVGDARRPQC